jgi:VanZ family protein
MVLRHRAWVLAALWAGLIFVLSSIPGSSMPSIRLFAHADKAAHMAVYGVLGLLCFVAARKTWNVRPRWLVVVATALAVCYGVTDELHQLLIPGRSADPRDVGADGVGALIASFVFARASARRAP